MLQKLIILEIYLQLKQLLTRKTNDLKMYKYFYIKCFGIA